MHINVYISIYIYDSQHTATHCSTLQQTTCFLPNCVYHSKKDMEIKFEGCWRGNSLQHFAIYCNTLYHCSTLHYFITHCNTLQHSATQCYTLQRTATHDNTLHHTARHSKAIQNTATCCRAYKHTGAGKS